MRALMLSPLGHGIYAAIRYPLYSAHTSCPAGFVANQLKRNDDNTNSNSDSDRFNVLPFRGQIRDVTQGFDGALERRAEGFHQPGSDARAFPRDVSNLSRIRSRIMIAPQLFGMFSNVDMEHHFDPAIHQTIALRSRVALEISRK